MFRQKVARILSAGRGLGGLIAATAAGQIIVVVASPILTRVFTPDDFGRLAVFTGLVGTIGSVVALRYESAIPLPKEEHVARSVLALCIALTIGTSLATGMVVWAANAQWIALPVFESILPYWWMVPPALISIGVYQSFSSWAIRKTEYGVLARTRVHQGVASVTTQLATGLLVPGPLGLFMGFVVGRSAGIRALAQSWSGKSGSLTRLFSGKEMRAVASRYRRFALFSTPSAFLDSLGLALPVFMLSMYYDEGIVGLYALTARVAGIPMTIIAASVANVYVGEAAEIVRNKPAEFPQFFKASLKKMTLFGLVGVLLPLVFLRPLIPWIFGTQWAEAGIYLQILAPMYAAQFISAPFGGTLGVLERQDLHLLREIVRTLITGSFLWLSAGLGMAPSWSIAFLGAAGVVGYAVYLYLTKVAVEQWARQNMSH